MLQASAVQTIPIALTHAGNSFLLVIGDRTVKQSTCEFLLTFSSMVATDIEEYLLNLSAACDHVRVPLSSRGDSVMLSLADFTRLRSAYGQMMFDLKLQDLLLRNGIACQSLVAS